MKFADLSNCSLEIIHDAFLDAFSDYVVPIQLSMEQLGSMLERRGYDPAISVGVFDGDRLVAFTLNGSGVHRGLLTVYDTGTGVRRSHRGQRLTRAMFEWVEKRLAPRRFGQYILEVITSNRRAGSIYEEIGFETVRELQCWHVRPTPDEQRPMAGVLIQISEDLDWNQARTFCDVLPSWQNSTDSIRRSRDARFLLRAEAGGAFVGYAVVFPASGDLPQLAVHPAWRRRDIGGSLLSHAASLSGSGELRVINVDDSVPGPRLFLQRRGGKAGVRQFEMRKNLDRTN